ncbi:uncharacterized protein LOC124133067 [Haliotis rufescens]|uniref:uncharacterized protein LOC124133067 n=1 Tax=Haliotis rufescens TaxID=6454 RepID=UPI00201EF7E3|nr:uncharacterized protein LOC124133067 [Haliotis rufescens]
MIERPLRRPGLQKQGDVPGKRGAWIEEAMEGLPLKQRQFQKTSEQAESNGLDVHGLDMPTAGPRSRRRSSLGGIEEDDYFSDSSEEEPDLSAMTEEERKEYLEAREKRRQEREKRMREKFGDKYDEMKRKKREQREAETRAKAEAAAVAAAAAAAEAAAEDASETAKGRGTSGPIRDLSTLQSKARQKPKSMVSYERGPAREVGGTIEKTDARDIGPSHSNWTKKTPRARDMPRKSRDEGFNFEFKPSKMPSIKLNIGDDKDVRRQSRAAQGHRVSFLENPDEVEPEEDQGRDSQLGDLGVFEIGEDGKLRVKAGEEIDLKRISSAVLRRLGIDPKLSTDEIVKQLKEKLGRDVVVKDGVFAIGTKPITAYDLNKVTDEMLAEDLELDINTLKGPRRVNVLMQRGGSELRDHLHRVMNQCRMQGKVGYAKDLDETDSSIDFLSHYRLVDPGKLEGYARAFVVEDRDLDTVINFLETQTALDGVTSIQHMTSKQIQYVLKVLDIDDASQVTFRMFAVITALCERVTQMDSISKHYLEICNLADIERKLDLYKAMFYHNVGSDRQTNFITSESLKIELIAGGLNWKQQEYIMEKMEPNSWGEISFLDYMCYIPLFMSMHDNICDNPLDMSDQKYVMPPRQRPPSPQRDMNPLGNALSKFSSFLMKKQARDLKDGRLDPKVVKEEQLTVLKSYAKLPDIDTFDKPKYNEDEEYETIDLIY